MSRETPFVDFPPCSIMLREGEAAGAIFIIEAGKAGIERNGEALAELGPGDFFGEAALLQEHGHAANAVARTAVRALRLDAATLPAVLRENVDVAMQLMRRLALRLRAAEARAGEAVPAKSGGAPADAPPRAARAERGAAAPGASRDTSAAMDDPGAAAAMGRASAVSASSPSSAGTASASQSAPASAPLSQPGLAGASSSQSALAGASSSQSASASASAGQSALAGASASPSAPTSASSSHSASAAPSPGYAAAAPASAAAQATGLDSPIDTRPRTDARSPAPAGAPAPTAQAVPAAPAVVTHLLRHAQGTIAVPAGKAECLVGRPDPATGAIPEINLGPLDLARSLSRRHARLLVAGNTVSLREEPGVANGTWVNGERLAAGQSVILKPGDKLRFGAIELEFGTA
jgi:pSer/pThr/pTyr-binding forkhead associated (FHA) protein